MRGRGRSATFALCVGLLAALTWAGRAAPLRVEGDTTRVHAVAPGDVVEAAVTLRNDGDAPLRVRLYLTDYVRDDRIGRRFPPAGATPRSNAPWITLSETDVTVPPGGSRRVGYRMAVPDDDRLRGTYWSALMVEPADGETVISWAPEGGDGGDGGDGDGGGGSEAASFRPQLSAAVRQIVRYQVNVVADVGDRGRPTIAFREPQLAKTEDGKIDFRVFVENTGDWWISPRVWLDLFDGGGRRAARVEAGQPRLYPGAIVETRFDLTGTPPGEYEAVLLVDGGEEAVFGTRFTLRFVPESAEGPRPPAPPPAAGKPEREERGEGR